MMMKTTGKKVLKAAVIGGMIIVFALCAVLLMQLVEHDKERDIWLIKYDIRNQFTYTVYADYVVLNRYWGDANVLQIPETMWGRPITVLDEYCFYDKPLLQQIQLTENITEMGKCAFLYCSNLETITSGANVQVIGDSCFEECYRLRTVEAGEYVYCPELSEETQEEDEISQEILHRAKWQEEGIRPYLEEYYPADEVDGLLETLKELVRANSSAICGGDINQLNWKLFTYDLYWINRTLYMYSHHKPDITFQEWLFGEY